ncbi:MAG: cobalt-precorrin-5B (C(1))-methyltransferase [Rhodobacterales bacterium]|nr:MAG: cobalt-precorrin-5B (C(1))-methyltransferase [Rhodobacterales bacterium]
MSDAQPTRLRRGWTTGACASAATKAALIGLWGGAFPQLVSITLPRGERPIFAVIRPRSGPGWAEVGIIKDAGDDPDVTHGCEVRVRVSVEVGSAGVQFRAGTGVGTVTRPGLPIAVGQPAINPKPRELMCGVVRELAEKYHEEPNVSICISIINGDKLAKRTWNPRLGIVGGLSVLGTTGIVRPFSCSAWIASIQRGVDVARAMQCPHVAGCTGATSQAVVQAHHGLPEQAMLDMGDFVGGLLKYLRRHPVPRLTIGGGIGKMTKLAQGAVDLHSKRSQVDFEKLADWLGDPRIAKVNTALQAYEIAGEKMADLVANRALMTVRKQLRDARISPDIIIIDRAGRIIAQAAE